MDIINIAQAGVISSAPPVSSLLTKVVTSVVTLVGSIAIIVIILAGLMYMTSGGETTRVQAAKKALTGGIIGLIVSILAYVIVKVIVDLV